MRSPSIRTLLCIIPMLCGSSVASMTPCQAGAKSSSWQDVACDPSTSTCMKYGWSLAPDSWACCMVPNAVPCSNGYKCCPEGTTCVDSGSSWSVQTKCMKNDEEVAVGQEACKNGPNYPMSTTKPNILILGDSVSIGYEPFVAEYMADVAFVQHTPWSGDGGSCTTEYTLKCLDRFLSSPSGEEIAHLDILYFNSGLHNLIVNGSGDPGQSGNTTVYQSELNEIATRLAAWAKPRGTKLLFALTSAFLCSVDTDDIVQNLNKEAAAVMAEHDIPTINLHDAIVAKCGSAPVDECFGHKDCFCPHCPDSDGYPWLANSTIIPALRKML